MACGGRTERKTTINVVTMPPNQVFYKFHKNSLSPKMVEVQIPQN